MKRPNSARHNVAICLIHTVHGKFYNSRLSICIKFYILYKTEAGGKGMQRRGRHATDGEERDGRHAVREIEGHGQGIMDWVLRCGMVVVHGRGTEGQCLQVPSHFLSCLSVRQKAHSESDTRHIYIFLMHLFFFFARNHPNTQSVRGVVVCYRIS